MLCVLYLDTNHISRLARFPGEVDSASVRQLLDRGGVHLGITWLHLQELSAPQFVSRSAVGAFLDSVPIAWAPAPDDLFELEVRAAIRHAMTGEPFALSPFSESFVHAFGAPPNADIPIAEMLEAMADHSHLRRHLEQVANHGAQMDAHFKKAAAVVRNPREPVAAHIGELNAHTTPAGIRLPRMFSPEEIIDLVGGLTGFPSINVAHSLARTRLKDESFPAGANDVMDEWHACYAPYAAVTALDHRTAARFRAARLPDAPKVTHRLQDVQQILANRLSSLPVLS